MKEWIFVRCSKKGNKTAKIRFWSEKVFLFLFLVFTTKIGGLSILLQSKNMGNRVGKTNPQPDVKHAMLETEDLKVICLPKLICVPKMICLPMMLVLT